MLPFLHVLPKNIPMGCPQSVLPEFFLRHTQVNGALSNTGNEADKDSLCLFRAMVMNVKGHNDCNSHTSRFFTDFVSQSGHDPEIFCGFSEEKLPVVKEMVQRNLFIFNFYIHAGEYVEELGKGILKCLKFG